MYGCIFLGVGPSFKNEINFWTLAGCYYINKLFIYDMINMIYHFLVWQWGCNIFQKSIYYLEIYTEILTTDMIKCLGFAARKLVGELIIFEAG